MTVTPVALIMFLALGAVAVVLALLLVRARQGLSRARLHLGTTETELESATRLSADLGARLQAVEAELRHLAEARIPDLATSLNHEGVTVRGPLGTATLSPDLDRSVEAVLTQVREEVVKERQRVDHAAQAATRGATTTIQALLYQLQSLLQRMQEKYDDPLVAEDLLAADFLNEQSLRRIQSTAVVCGAWPGLTRGNSHLGDIVVGATSRLSGYERVQVSNQLRDPVGVIARAVEPVAVALTELMANALHYSHPDLPVVVTLQQGNRGVSVIIDDAGVGMHSDETARAKRLMSGEKPALITELGDPPRTGFAAIGQLVRQYGFSTHVETSPYGGVRAIVHIPGEPLLTVLDEAEQPMSAMTPTPPEGTPVLTGIAAMESPLSTPVSQSPEQSVELPRRRRRRPLEDGEGTPEATGVAAGTAAAKATEPELPVSTPQESAERWSALQQGTASGRAAAGTATGGAPDAATPHEAAEATEAPPADRARTDATRSGATRTDEAGDEAQDGAPQETSPWEGAEVTSQQVCQQAEFLDASDSDPTSGGSADGEAPGDSGHAGRRASEGNPPA